MNEWTAVISASSGLLGACIGGGITFLSQSLERRQRARTERAAELIAFGQALDTVRLVSTSGPGAAARAAGSSHSRERLERDDALSVTITAVGLAAEAEYGERERQQDAERERRDPDCAGGVGVGFAGCDTESDSDADRGDRLLVEGGIHGLSPPFEVVWLVCETSGMRLRRH